jgi:hypothetical protein
MVVTTWFGGAGGGGGCSCCCGGSGGIIAAEAAARRYQNAAGRIVRRLRARERAEDPAEQPRPGRRSVLPAMLPPPPSPALTPSSLVPASVPSLPGRRRLRPGSSRAPNPSPGTPREVVAKRVERRRGAAGAARRSRAEKGMGLRGFAFSPRAQVLSRPAAAVMLASLQPVARSRRELPSVSHGVRDRE